jgi:hypothetical protein
MRGFEISAKPVSVIWSMYCIIAVLCDKVAHLIGQPVEKMGQWIGHVLKRLTLKS